MKISFHPLALLVGWSMPSAESLRPSTRLLLEPTSRANLCTRTLPRRSFLQTSCEIVSGGLSAGIVWPGAAYAVVPLTKAEADAGIGLPFRSRPKPPSPTKVQRQRLNQDFAVLLTRSTFSEAVQLEMGPSSQLERDMYLVRTAELEPYRQQVGSVMTQGDLAEPYYFDYMSYVQYATINRAMKYPETEYEQMEPIVLEGGVQTSEYEKKLVRRSVPDQLLATTYNERVGTAILNYFQDRNKGSSIAIPDYGYKPDKDQVLGALTQLLNLFLMAGFAWEGQVEDLTRNASSAHKSACTFRLTLENPATLWSGQCLQKQQAPLRNDFLLQTAKELVRSMGYAVMSSSVKIQGNQEVSLLTIE